MKPSCSENSSADFGSIRQPSSGNFLISIDDADLPLVKDVTLMDIYSYMNYLAWVRGLSNTSRSRKIATLQLFYKYLTNKAKLLEVNPIQALDSPKLRISLPKYLKFEEYLNLLAGVDSKNDARTTA